MDRDKALAPLIKLAEQSAATWRRVRGEAFAGETTIETGNTLYRFKDGLFFTRAPRPEAPTIAGPKWETPANMRGVELIGFLADEGGFWSFSPRWRRGALAVLTTSDKTFTLTSPTRDCTIRRPRVAREVPERSDVFPVPGARPLAVRKPAPTSMTRIQAAPAMTR